MSARSVSNARAGLMHLYPDRPDRAGRDRLEILTALIEGRSFDPTFRPDVIEIPSQHPIYRWECVVDRCERPRSGGSDLCTEHRQGWAVDRERGVGKAAFLVAAVPLQRQVQAAELVCRICPQRPAAHAELRLCRRHTFRWNHYRKITGPGADFTEWLSAEQSLPGHGICLVAVCVDVADSPLGLCPWHGKKYERDGRPGGGVLSQWSWHRYEQFGLPVLIEYTDEATFRRWCATTAATPWPGQVNLLGLRPLVCAEIKWGIFMLTQRPRPTRRDLAWIRTLVFACRSGEVDSLVGYDFGTGISGTVAGIVKQILHELRLVYFTLAETREAGFLETDHFGVRFPDRRSHFDLTDIGQRWLRELTWDHLAGLLTSARCPRTGGVFDAARRGAVELGAFLEIDAPDGGHDPRVLDAEHMRRSSPTNAAANATAWRRWP